MALTQVTTGMLADASVTQAKMAAGVAGNGPAFSAFQSVPHTVSANTFTKINLQAELFDTAGAFDTTTNYRFQPTVAGYYQINAALGTTTNLISTTYFDVFLVKNGVAYAQATAYPAPSNYFSAFVGALVYLNGSTDYVELYGQSNATFNTNAGSTNTYLSGALVRAA